MNYTDQTDARIGLGCILLLVLTQGRLEDKLNSLKISHAELSITESAEIMRARRVWPTGSRMLFCWWVAGQERDSGENEIKISHWRPQQCRKNVGWPVFTEDISLCVLRWLDPDSWKLAMMGLLMRSFSKQCLDWMFVERWDDEIVLIVGDFEEKSR